MNSKVKNDDSHRLVILSYPDLHALKSYLQLRIFIYFQLYLSKTWTKSSRISYEIVSGRRKSFSKFFWNRGAGVARFDWVRLLLPANEPMNSQWTNDSQSILYIRLVFCPRFYAGCHIRSKVEMWFQHYYD